MAFMYLILNLKCELDDECNLIMQESDAPENVKENVDFDNGEVDVEVVLGSVGEDGWILISVLRINEDVISYTFMMETDDSDDSDEKPDEYQSCCWSCGTEINSDYCNKCSTCGWYECPDCNSCDCNRDS